MKKLLVVVDVQNDFVDGSLGFENAGSIIDNIIKHINDFLANGDEVVFTLDEHGDDYLNTTEGIKLPISHCIKGDTGFQIVEQLKPYFLNKKSFIKGSFASLELAKYIEKKQFDEVYLCGLVGDICVFCNAIIAKSALSNKGQVYLYSDASISPDLNHQKTAFEMLEYLHINIL